MTEIPGSDPTSTPQLPVGAALMAAVLGGSGVLHLVRPALYRSLVPPAFPNRTAVIYVSGVAELVCATGLLSRRRWAPAASAALLLAVWPGNWQMAVDVQRDPDAQPWKKAALWARVPLQVPMIKAVLSARRPAEAG